MFRKLLVAIRRPFSCSPLFCCSSAFSGTANNPAKKPTIVRLTAAVAGVADCERKIAKAPMPIDPIGARPSSTLSPESRPATTLPTPMPMAANAVSNPIHRPSSRSTSVPNSTVTSCSSEPRNQKYEMPITVSHSTRSRRSRFRPSTISPIGFNRSRLPGAAAGTCGMPKLDAVPMRAIATTVMPTSHSWAFHASSM